MTLDVSQPIPRWPGEFVDLPAGQLFVRTAPAAPGAVPAVFIHGLGGSATNWTDLMDQLSRSSDPQAGLPPLACTAVDLPGFGVSPPRQDGEYTISAHADSVIEYLEKQARWPVHLVGNSMGGAIATKIAARRPDLVRSLILISPALPDLRPRLLPLRLVVASAPGIGPALLDWLGRAPAELRADRTIKELYFDPGVVHPVRRAEQIEDIRQRDQLAHAQVALILSARSLVTEYARAGRGSLWWDARRVRVPVLILHGSNDRLVNPATAGKAARWFRDGRVVVLSRLGHVAMMERPTVVASVVRPFLAGLAVPPAVGPAGESAQAIADGAAQVAQGFVVVDLGPNGANGSVAADHAEDASC